HVQAGNLPGILRRLALRIIEVGRHRNDSVFYLLAEISCSIVGKFAQNERRDLFRRIELTIDIDTYSVVWSRNDFVTDVLDFLSNLRILSAHETFYRIHGTFRVEGRLPFCNLAH